MACVFLDENRVDGVGRERGVSQGRGGGALRGGGRGRGSDRGGDGPNIDRRRDSTDKWDYTHTLELQIAFESFLENECWIMLSAPACLLAGFLFWWQFNFCLIIQHSSGKSVTAAGKHVELLVWGLAQSGSPEFYPFLYFWLLGKRASESENPDQHRSQRSTRRLQLRWVLYIHHITRSLFLYIHHRLRQEIILVAILSTHRFLLYHFFFSPQKFSSASKYAALLMDGEQAEDGDAED